MPIFPSSKGERLNSVCFAIHMIRATECTQISLGGIEIAYHRFERQNRNICVPMENACKSTDVTLDLDLHSQQTNLVMEI